MINKNKNELKDLQIQGQIKIIQLTNDITGGIIKTYTETKNKLFLIIFFLFYGIMQFLPQRK